MDGITRIAHLIADRVRRPNPIVGGTIVEDLGLVNDTPTVLVRTGGTTRKVAYLPMHAIQVDGQVFITRMGGDTAAPLICPATNYQVSGAGDTIWGGPGGGAAGWGATGGTWGSDEG